MAEATTPARRWDPIVRITHWSIVLAVLANAVVAEEGSPAHVWVGYALAGILSLRLLWGLVGPAEARFVAFFPSPSKALAHIRDIKAGRATDHPSHNPLGALMVYAIWSCLAVIIGTGIAMAGIPGSIRGGEGVVGAGSATLARSVVESRYNESGERPQPEEHDEEIGGEESALTEVHEIAANLLYLLILLHVAGVAFETRRSGLQVVLAMLPERR